MNDFSVLIIGLGSMGKRRIRNLRSLGIAKISGFDLRSDRCQEVDNLYSIPVFDKFDTAVINSRPNVLIISVSPDAHHIYMKHAIDLNCSFFVEASVIDKEMDEIIQLVNAKNIFAAPSSTMFFHPAIQLIVKFVKSGYLGKLSNIIYHMGNYLPDWHSYENVADFYVSKKDTGGAREIVPFELTWLVKMLGYPIQVGAIYRQTIDIEGAPDIDDTYNILMNYHDFTVVMTVDVVTKSSTRRILINGSEKELIWDWDDNCVRVYHYDKKEWETFQYETMPAESGYNKNITEQMYIDEMDAFFKGIKNRDLFINSLQEDHRVLKLLYSIEKSWNEKKFVTL